MKIFFKCVNLWFSFFQANMKIFVSKVAPFVGSFVVGVFASFLLTFNETLPKFQKISNPQSQSTFFEPPKPLKCKTQEDMLAKLIQRRAELKVWLENNKDAPKKKYSAKSEELRKLNDEIEDIERWNHFKKHFPKDKENTTDLLYRCN